MNHYTFKYINSEKKELLFDYEIENNADIKVTKLDKEMTVTINKIKNTKVEVTQIPKGRTSVKIPAVNYKYLQVIGYVKDGPINEYVAYNALEQKTGQESGGNTSLVIVIIIAVILLFFNAKNKDLIEKVNKIIFVSSESKPKGEANLLMDDNEFK
jgi:hypothetical protein